MPILRIEVPTELLPRLRTDVRNEILTNRDEDGNLIVPFEYQEFLFDLYKKLLQIDPNIAGKGRK